MALTDHVRVRTTADVVAAAATLNQVMATVAEKLVATPLTFDVIIDASNDVPFTVSLGNRFGISFTEYENQFFGLMDDYLP